MRLWILRRRWIVAAVVLILAFAAVRSLDRPSWIDYYRVIDDHRLVVETVEGSGAWTRVTSVIETPSTITITVSSILVQLGPHTAEGISVDSVVTLHDPIGSRTVLDGSNGLPVVQTRCLPPTYAAPGCIESSPAPTP